MPEPFYTELKPAAAPFDMIFVQGGSFRMGSDDSEAFEDEKPVHAVNLPDFYIGKFLVTNALWKAVLNEDSPSNFKGSGHRPVERISWNDVTRRFLPALQLITGKPYRLPTEAEWEYAARGGVYSEGYLYVGSDKLTEVGWFRGNSSKRTQKVGQLYPNELGVYDMSGNVWEWVEDHWHDDYINAPEDGSAWLLMDKDGHRVYRGGSWINTAQYCRASCRNHSTPVNQAYSLGFRLAFSLKGSG